MESAPKVQLGSSQRESRMESSFLIAEILTTVMGAHGRLELHPDSVVGVSNHLDESDPLFGSDQPIISAIEKEGACSANDVWKLVR